MDATQPAQTFKKLDTRKDEHFSEVFEKTDVEAALAAGIFHREKVPIEAVKKHMRDPKLDLEIGDNEKAILVVECHECGDKSRFLLDEVSPATSVLCNCGGVLNITENGLKSIHQKLDDTKNT